MRKSDACVILVTTLAAFAAAAAEPQGLVTKVLRPELSTFDEKGQPSGRLKASQLKLPAPIVSYGAGRSIGVRLKDRVVYLRGLDVQTSAKSVDCAPVQGAVRAKGSAYAAANMGLGGAADCKKAK